MELVVVLAIAAVLVAVAAFSIPGLRFDRTQVAADTLAAHLRYARDMAVNRERTTCVAFSVTSNRYAVYIATNDAVAYAAASFVPAKDPVDQTDWVVILSNDYPEVALSTTTSLLFSRTNGIPCDISGVPLTATTTVTFASGRTVTISPQTGFVRVQ
jgi:Tfp pilus assembly protein FimT